MRLFGGNLHRRIGLVLLEVEEGEAVVDRRIGAAGQHELDRLVETIRADELGAGLRGELAEVARQRLRGLLALEIGEILDVGVAVLDDQHGLGGDVGIGEIILLLAGVGDADLVDDGVVAVGVEAGDQAVPLAFEELCLDAELGGDRFGDLDIEAGELVVLVMIGERRIGAFRADLQHAGRLDRLEVVAGMCRQEERGLYKRGSSGSLQPVHRFLPFLERFHSMSHTSQKNRSAEA